MKQSEVCSCGGSQVNKKEGLYIYIIYIGKTTNLVEPLKIGELYTNLWPRVVWSEFVS